MPKVKISEYSATANSNTDVASINIDEGCAPSGINNAIRAVMGHLKDFQQGTNGDPFNGPVNGTLGATTASTANVTTLTTSSTVTHNGGTPNGVAYLNGAKVLTTGSVLVFDGTKLSIGSGNSTAAGLTAGYFGASGYGAIWSTSVTPSTTNFAFLTNGASTVLNGSSNVTFQVNNADSMALTSTGLEVKQSQLIGYSSYAGIGTNGLAVAGNVGIGTSSPGFRLSVVGGQAQFSNGSNLYLNATATEISYYTDAAIPQVFYTNTLERARISADGTFRVKGAGTAGSTDAFQVAGGAPADAARIDSSGNFFVNNMAVGGTANLHWSSGNGQFFVTSSSRRFKHDIVEYDKGLAELMQMQPKYFVYNDEPNQKQRAGFIAEDFHDLGMTEYVEYWKDDEGNDTPSEIGYSNMVAILVKSIQEQQALITQLTARITALEGA